MNTSGEAADQVVRMSLEVGEAALKDQWYRCEASGSDAVCSLKREEKDKRQGKT